MDSTTLAESTPATEPTARRRPLDPFEVASKGTVWPLHKGERIATPARPCAQLLSVVSGAVAVCAVTPDGRRQILCLNLPGDILCPMSVDGAECWSEALTDSEVRDIPLAVGDGDPRAEAAMTRMMFALAHERLERAARHVFTLGRLDGTERICAFLGQIARQTGTICETGIRATLPMSREDIADYLGLNAETVSRLLSRMKRIGLVRFATPTEFEVPDLARLEARVPVSAASGLRGPRQAEDSPGD